MRAKPNPFFILVIILAYCLPAAASYRVYQLKIEYYDAYGKLEKTDHVLSILDRLQYEHYYSGYRWSRVTMDDTWYCPGDTGNHREYCPRPKEPVRGPASLAHESRVPLPLNRQPIIP